MLRAITALFSSSMIGRALGLLRFQLLLIAFSQSGFTDSVIYVTTLIWTINNFFVVPTVNRNLIAELASVEKGRHPEIIKAAFFSVFKVSLISAFCTLICLFLLNQWVAGFDYSKWEMLVIFLIIAVLGTNEIFSLYNQFNKKYFLYGINPAIWNGILSIGVLFLWLLDTESILIYLSFLALSIGVSIFIQFRYSGLDFEQIVGAKINNLENRLLNVEHKYWYNGTVILFMGTTFFDLNVLKFSNTAGLVTVYSIILKLPELLVSVINGSIQPVFFNAIIKRTKPIVQTFFKFFLFSLLGFIFLAIVTFIFNQQLFLVLFNFNVGEYSGSSFLAICMLFISTLSYMLIRLSVEFNYSKSLFFITLIGVILKSVLLIMYHSGITYLISLNILFFLLIFCFGLFKILGTNSEIRNSLAK